MGSVTESWKKEVKYLSHELLWQHAHLHIACSLQAEGSTKVRNSYGYRSNGGNIVDETGKKVKTCKMFFFIFHIQKIDC